MKSEPAYPASTSALTTGTWPAAVVETRIASGSSGSSSAASRTMWIRRS